MFILIVDAIPDENKLKGGGKGGRPKGHKPKGGDKQPDKQPEPDVCRSSHPPKPRGTRNKISFIQFNLI